MITLIHGDDIVFSRNFFIKERQEKKDSYSFSGDNIMLTDIVQITEGNSLFGTTKTIFIEELLAKKKLSKETEEIINYLNKNNNNIELFLWEGKILTPKQLSLFPKSLVKLFKLPQTVFTFLDELKPNSGAKLISLFHQTLKNSEAEFIFYMLIRQFRLLIALSSNSKDNIDEVKRLSPWQKSKLQKQANLFSISNLANTYKKLYEIDLKQKTGKLNLNLTQSIDFLLLDL